MSIKQDKNAQAKQIKIYGAELTTKQTADECQRKKEKRDKVFYDFYSSLANSKNGRLLTPTWIGTSLKSEWQCSNNHKWLALASTIKKGGWCPYCAGKVISHQLDKLKNYVHAKHGTLLTPTYTKNSSFYKVKCDKGHIWETQYSSLVNAGKWCPKCAHNAYTPDLFLKNMQDMARSKRGLCVSKEYVSSKTKYTFKCKEDHEWDAQYSSIVRDGTWCPYCSCGTTERMVRNLFEQLFEVPFKKEWPTWLRNSRNNKMELDGYNEMLKLAFEYNGVQHYVFKNYWYKHESEFEQRKKDDADKENITCIQGITLITIPYTTADDMLLLYIYKKLIDFKRYDLIDVLEKIAIKNGVSWNNTQTITSENGPFAHINISYIGPNYEEQLDKLKKVAQQKGGRCLSQKYSRCSDKYDMQCKEGHVWQASFSALVGLETWCPICSGRQVDATKRMLELTSIINGKGHCIDTTYIGALAFYKFACNCGHTWNTTYDNIRRGGWCAKCARNKVDPKEALSVMQEIAASKNGVCLSKTYVKSITKYLFECAKKHQFELTHNALTGKDTWCSICAKNRVEPKEALSAMQKIAASKNGVCLSKSYLKSLTKYAFECEQKHQFELTYTALTGRSRWCSICARDKIGAKKSEKFYAQIKDYCTNQKGAVSAERYKNESSILTFECQNKHSWQEPWGTMRARKYFCVQCSTKQT